MQKITPFLWFDSQAEEAAAFYTSIFKNSRIVRTVPYPEGAPTEGEVGKAGSVMTVEFELEGQSFLALNGGPLFPFTEAISLSVDVESQEELDELWDKLTAGGEEVQCGWLKDKFGLSWQLNPGILGDMFAEGTPEQTARVMKVMLGMVKLDIEKLKAAYAG
jgi:predicted 3-demethylubiquinone-9 3-methyltransferase (glyoxalase superfamily)